MGVNLVHDFLPMFFYGLDAYPEQVGHLLVGISHCDQTEDFRLAIG